MSTRKERAKNILKSIIDDRAKTDVSTTDLLYRCQEISILLVLGEIAKWIDFELTGYPPVIIEQPSTLEVFPLYRHVRITVEVNDPRIPFRDSGFETHAPFLVTFSCGQLENASQPLPISFSATTEVPKLGVMGEIGEKEAVTLAFESQLSVELAGGIVEAIRGRISQFASSHYTALCFEEPLYGIIDDTRELIADRLSQLHPPTLALIDETLSKQEVSSDPIEWQDVLENVRNIIRNFTEHLLRDSMVPSGEIRPNLNETNKKTKMILDWVRANVTDEIGTEMDYIIESLGSLTSQQTVLMKLVNKRSHPPGSTAVKKGDVDRIILITIIW
ncbi:MAG: hypothetical protein RTU92_04250, partial [Candidatus Thorarchaeota archaeon]